MSAPVKLPNNAVEIERACVQYGAEFSQRLADRRIAEGNPLDAGTIQGIKEIAEVAFRAGSSVMDRMNAEWLVGISTPQARRN